MTVKTNPAGGICSTLRAGRNGNLLSIAVAPLP